jgi:hypothetical protein
MSCCGWKIARIIAKNKCVNRKKLWELGSWSKKNYCTRAWSQKKTIIQKKKISGLGGSRTRDVHDRSLQTRRDAPVSIATRCIVGSSCNVYVRIIISNRPVTDYPKIEYIRRPRWLPSWFVPFDSYYILFHPQPGWQYLLN